MTIPQRKNAIYDDITQLIGNTPLVRLKRIPEAEGCVANILVKMEFFNPLSSSKDRTALGMIDAAEKEGRLKPGGLLVEATSGNTGIGLAFICAVRGYQLILTMPENMSMERRKLLAFLGARIELTPAAEGMAGALKKAEEIVKESAGAMKVGQFDNPANPAIHKATTAQEIWNDTEGVVDAFVAGVGTAGTIQGVATGLREHNKDIKIIAVQPAASPVLSGGKAGVHKIQGIGANFVPPLLDMSNIDEVISISDDEALTYARRLAREEGLLAGISSGAALAAGVKLARRSAMARKTIVVLLPDSAERYLSTELFD